MKNILNNYEETLELQNRLEYIEKLVLIDKMNSEHLLQQIELLQNDLKKVNSKKILKG